jgi:hypothetical protein
MGASTNNVHGFLDLYLTLIPSLRIRPFHAAVGIMTTRMLINLRKATSTDSVDSGSLDMGSTLSTRTGPGSMRFQSRTQSNIRFPVGRSEFEI